jgi:cytochrome b involved in lipid metabolism
MHRLLLFVTMAFRLLVAGICAAGVLSPVLTAAPAAAASDERVISGAELARHARANDCWMAIRGGVYDLTSFLPRHPSRPEIIAAWCGREATQAYDTKTKGRRHSERADKMLPGYRIGSFAPDSR